MEKTENVGHYEKFTNTDYENLNTKDIRKTRQPRKKVGGGEDSGIRKRDRKKNETEKLEPESSADITE